MKFTFFLFHTLLFFLNIGPLYAIWPKTITTTLEKSPFRNKQLKTHYATSTLWGGVKRFVHFSPNQGKLIEIPSLNVESKKINVYYSQNPQSEKLAIFMPGVFGQPYHRLTPQIITLLEKADVNVLVVPNILSEMYLSEKPNYQKNTLLTDIYIMEESVEFILKKNPKIKKIQILAESLGSAVASSWAVYDSKNKKRINSMVLLWPPVNINMAMKNFDEIFFKYDKHISNCSTLKIFWIILTNYLFSSLPPKLSPEENQCSGVMVFNRGFLQGLKNSMSLYQKSLKADEIKVEAENITHFEHFFQNFYPTYWSFISQNSPELDLSFWFKQLPTTLLNEIYIFTSKDDFLNSGLNWGEFQSKSSISDKNIILFEWGGHAGPLGDSHFQKSLSAIFSI